MKTLDIEPIIGTKQRPWFDVFRLDVDRATAAEWFDRQAHVAWVDGLGDADYWAVEFDCGVWIAFEFLHNGSGGSVLATEPVAQHVSRHLTHWRTKLHEFAPDALEPDRKSMIHRFNGVMPQLTELDTFQLWRQGDDGNRIRVGVPTSKRDAECWLAELESRKHKQTYWVSRVDIASTDHRGYAEGGSSPRTDAGGGNGFQ